MEVLVCADIHGNLPALEAVLAEALERQVDQLVCVGDILGVLGWPNECAKLVRDVSEATVYGNHDAYFRDDYSWVPRHPSQKQEHRVVTNDIYGCVETWINELPEEESVYYSGDRLYLVHANPFANRKFANKWGEHKCGYPANGYAGKSEYVKIASDIDARYVAVAHTHRQAKLDASKFGHDTIVFNPGSVGAPFDEAARFAVLDTEQSSTELCETDYDTSKVLSRFEELDITQDGDYP